MQFKVPQNIDLEDKIVGPLTLIQFVYCLVGGLICYIIFQLLPTHLGIVLLFDIPIALVALALAFLKIQDQPLSHFIMAGIEYYQRPKTRFWARVGVTPIIINAPEPVKKVEMSPMKAKKIVRSDLEKLAYVLDTKPKTAAESQNFGKITQSFEKIISGSVGTKEYNQIFNSGGANGTVGRQKT